MLRLLPPTPPPPPHILIRALVFDVPSSPGYPALLFPFELTVDMCSRSGRAAWDVAVDRGAKAR